MKRLTFSLNLIFCLFLCVGLMGCIKSELTPVENAALNAKQITQTYTKLYDNYNRLSATLQGEDLEKLRKAAPLLNKVKKYLIKHNSLVMKWQKTGVADFSVLIKNKEIMQEALDSALNIMLEFL